MDSTSASNVENVDHETLKKSIKTVEKMPSMEKLESMVTPEQVHSASVAKKRRTITRKRTNELNKARSQTPMRAQCPAGETSTDEDVEFNPEERRRPRTPDRKRKTVPRSEEIEQNVRVSNKEVVEQKNSKNDLKRDNENKAENAVVEVDESKQKKIPAQLESIQNDELSKKQQHQKVALEITSEKEDKIGGEIPKKRQPQKLAEVPTEEEENVEPTIIAQQILPKEEQFEVIPSPAVQTHPEPVFRKPRPRKPDSESNSERQSVISELGQHERSSSLPRQLEEQMLKLDNFVSTNTAELKHLFQRAKSTVEEKSKELRRRKFKKTDEKQRSQSQPRQLNEKELIESFKLAQKATASREEERLRSQSMGRYSYGSENENDKDSPERVEPKRPVRKRILVQDIIKEKKIEEKRKQVKLKDTVKCNKIVEVLDPMTSKVIEVKNVGEVTNMRFVDAFKIFRFYSLRQILREYRKYKVDMDEEYKTIRRQRRKCINHLLILMIFCGLGGILFKFIEGSFENFYKCGVKRVKRDFIELLWAKSHNMREEEWKSLARNRLRIFEEELHNAHEAGIHSYSGQKSWSFLNGIVYCLTVVTTIGYGHLYPTTKTGQALTIVYSLIGIPLFLIILTDFGKMFTRWIKFLWSFVRRLYYTGSCRQIRKTSQAQDLFKGAQMMYEIATFRRPSAMGPNMMQSQPQSSPQESTEGTTAPPTPAISNFEIDDEFNLPISVAILLLVLYIFLGAVLFAIWEGWEFFASFYFVFISMSTIGFGDYVPRHPIFMIVSIVYLVFGLALMSMCINVVQVKISDTFNQASAKIGATIGFGVAPEDGTIQIVPPIQIEMPAVHGSITDLNKLSPNTSMKS